MAHAQQHAEALLAKEEVEEFRRLLAEHRRIVQEGKEVLKQELHSEEQDVQQASSVPTHPADLASETYQRDFNAEELAHEQNQLGAIDQALARIEEGSFGRCLADGKQIPRKRLLARPWAKYCIDHAKELHD
jgi:RNA polymerase-binding protein DksA